MTFLLLILPVFAISLELQASDVSKNVVSPHEAKPLVLAALPLSVKKLSGIETEPGEVRGRFDFFTVTWAQTLAEGSVVAANYAVDLRTGDVFSSVITCDEVKTPMLRKLQQRIRAKLGLSQKTYLAVKSTGPLCER